MRKKQGLSPGISFKEDALSLPDGGAFPFAGVVFFVFIGIEAVFIAIEVITLVVHPAIVIIGPVPLHLAGKGIFIFFLPGNKQPSFMTDLRICPAAVFHDLVGHLVDVPLGLQRVLRALPHGPADCSDPLGVHLHERKPG